MGCRDSCRIRGVGEGGEWQAEQVRIQEAAKTQHEVSNPRAGEIMVVPQLVATPKPKRSSISKAKASKTNRGTVERMESGTSEPVGAQPVHPVDKEETKTRTVKGQDVGQTTILKFLGKNWKQWMIQEALAVLADEEKKSSKVRNQPEYLTQINKKWQICQKS